MVVSGLITAVISQRNSTTRSGLISKIAFIPKNEPRAPCRCHPNTYLLRTFLAGLASRNTGELIRTAEPLPVGTALIGFVLQICSGSSIQREYNNFRLRRGIDHTLCKLRNSNEQSQSLVNFFQSKLCDLVNFCKLILERSSPFVVSCCRS